ncbi:hypothetical protein KA107_03155 [Candidatus Pacearchaeota archaeon]|nr:hypothetical protein [Candidatus Pacearchaeota archaeon]
MNNDLKKRLVEEAIRNDADIAFLEGLRFRNLEEILKFISTNLARYPTEDLPPIKQTAREAYEDMNTIAKRRNQLNRLEPYYLILEQILVYPGKDSEE